MHGILALTSTFILGVISGLIGILAGGCSLFSIPALIFLGLPPHMAIATNRFGMIGLMLGGGLAYHRKNLIDYKTGSIIAVTAVFGAIVGANVVMALDEALVKKGIGVMMVVLIAFLLTAPRKGIEPEEKRIRKRHYFLGAMINFGLGIYGGMYGANVATMMMFVQVHLFGKTFIESSATCTIAMFSFSVAAAVVFMMHHLVQYQYAVVLFVGMGIGSAISAHYSERIGNRWIRRAIIGMSIALGAGLFLKQ